MSASQVLEILRGHGLRLSRSLGQNFLVDDNILAKIVQAAEPGPKDAILEVGAGIGTLTEALAASGANVVAVEVDRRLLPVLHQVIAARPNVTIMAKDAMKLTPADLTEPLVVNKMVANLPYNIAAPLLLDLAEIAPAITTYTVMVQKEIAQRMCARPGSKIYGAYTIKLSYYFESKILFHVGANAFIPKPRVESSVVRLVRRPSPPVEGEREQIFRLINASFSQRRKMMLTSVAEYLADKLSKKAVREFLEAAGVDPEARPERLVLADFARLASEYAGRKSPIDTDRVLR